MLGSHKRKKHCVCKQVYNKKPVKQGSKNIFIKMLKDVGMTVPKSRESAVYWQQGRGRGQNMAVSGGSGEEGDPEVQRNPPLARVLRNYEGFIV